MDKLVMLKSSRYGLEIHLNPQAEFSKLLREMERKLKASIKFFEGAKMAVEFKDRLLSQAEEDQLLELISKTAGIDVVCIIDRNQTKEMAYKSVIEHTMTNVRQKDGQLNGKGYNSDATTSVKNGNFILEPQTDFIFAIIGEELGFVGCCVVIILLLLIVIECIVIGLRAKDTGGRIICGGVGALVGIQTFINISVATGIFPNTGISLPVVSSGLTSLVCFFAGIGLVLNVGLQPKKYQ